MFLLSSTKHFPQGYYCKSSSISIIKNLFDLIFVAFKYHLTLLLCSIFMLVDFLLNKPFDLLI